jgi:SRSO17 transposase
MDHRRADDSGSRFAAYVEGLVSVIGHADRARPLRDYCMGLMMPCERKSVEPMAAVTAPARVAAQHQSLLHFVGEGRWSDDKVLAKVREMVLPAMQRHGSIEAWIIDDTGFPKQGRHSVGVARQYCGQLGKEDNCQVAVSLSLANGHASLPVAYRLYLPKEWSDDRDRLHKAGAPEDIGFQTKHEIALAQLRWASEAGLPRGAGVDLRRRHFVEYHGVASRHSAAVSKEVVGSGTATQAVAARRHASTSLGQGTRAWPAQVCLAHHQMARRHR